jgi:hypothetical protein
MGNPYPAVLHRCERLPETPSKVLDGVLSALAVSDNPMMAMPCLFFKRFFQRAGNEQTG